MADGDKIDQDEIEELLRQGQRASAAPSAAAVSRPVETSSAPSGSEVGDDIQLLLQQAQQAIESVDQRRDDTSPATPFAFQDLAGTPPSTEKATIELLRDVELDLKIELGRTNMYLEDVLKLRRESVVPLDKMAGDPVDIYVNGRLIARGEVLVLNDNFCVRVAELLAGDDVE
jgi:flagellar motor switch protein FliN/FliY